MTAISSSIDGSADAPLRSPEDWVQATGRPVVLVGNGPSAFLVDPRRIPADAVVIRMNAFMFEPDYFFGDRVDGFFWAIGRRWLQVAAAVAKEGGIYRFGTFFAPLGVLTSGLAAFRDEHHWLRATLDPLRSHFDMLQAVPMLRPWFAPRADRKHRGLPTQGMQALATLLAMGFRDIRISGMDFYQSTTTRYAFPYPEVVLRMTAPVHLRPGYENTHHSIEIDLTFLRDLQALYPDACISSLSAQSFLCNFVPLAPHPGEWPLRHSVRSAASVAPARAAQRPAGRTKDLAGFVAALEARLLAPFAAPRALCGEVARMQNGRVIIWGWRPDEADFRRVIRVEPAEGKPLDLVAKAHLQELELSCIGDAAHAAVVPAANLQPQSAGALTVVRDAATGRILEGGVISAYCFPVTDKPNRSQIVLLGFAVPTANERLAIDRLLPGDTVVALHGNDHALLQPGGPAGRIEATLPAAIPSAARREVAALLGAIEQHADQVVRIGGYALFDHDRTALLQVARHAPAAFQTITGALRAGAAATLVPVPDALTQQLEHLMKPIAIVLEHNPLLTADTADQVSVCHALLRALPLARRIDPGLWEIDAAARLQSMPSGSTMLIDGETLANMPLDVFDRLVATIAKSSLAPVVVVQALETGWAGETFRLSLADRMRRIAERGGRFYAGDSHVARLLGMSLGIGRGAIRTAPAPQRWRPATLTGRASLSVLAITDPMTEPDAAALRLWWQIALSQGRSPLSLDVAHEGGMAPSRPDGSGAVLTLGIPMPTPEEIARYDAVIVATEDVGARLAIRLVAALGDRCPPVLVCGSAGLAMSVPQEAVHLTLTDALARLVGTAPGTPLPAAMPPAAARDPWETCADLIGFVLPGEAVMPWVIEGLAAAERPGSGLLQGADVDFVITASGRDGDTPAALQVRLENTSPNLWLPAAVAGRGGTEIVLAIQPAEAAQQTVLAHPLGADVPPGGIYFADFETADTPLAGPVTIELQLRQGLDKAIIASARRLLVFS